jgi:hypothetical protein
MHLITIVGSQLDRVTGATASTLPLVQRVLTTAVAPNVPKIVIELHNLEQALLAGKPIARVNVNGVWHDLPNHYP